MNASLWSAFFAYYILFMIEAYVILAGATGSAFGCYLQVLF